MIVLEIRGLHTTYKVVENWTPELFNHLSIWFEMEHIKLLVHTAMFYR